MGGTNCRNALIAALSLAVLAGAACARNNEEGVGANPGRADSTMGNRRDSTTMQTGRADTSSMRRDTSSYHRDTTSVRSPTSTTSSNTMDSTSSSSSTSTTSPSTGSTTTSPGTGTTSSPSTGSTTSPNSSGTTSTSTPQASGPSAAGYSYEPSAAALGAAVAGAAQQQLTDANILAMLDQADMGDSASGTLAMQKAANPQVKDYGRMMTRDHHQSREKGQKLAKDLKITPQASSDNPIATKVKQDAAALESTPKGTQFDKTYIDQQVAMHQQVIEFAKQAQQTTKNEKIKQLIEENSPVLQRHLQRAQELQQSLGRMPT